jgi:hypothetical protein
MTFEEEFAAAPLRHIFISVRGARGRNPYDPGRAIEGAYKVVGNQIIMCDSHGREVVDQDGRKYRHTLGKDDLNEREAASLMVKEIKSRLKINGENRVNGFGPGQPIQYPRGYGGSIV